MKKPGQSVTASHPFVSRALVIVSRCLGSVFLLVVLSCFTPLANHIARSVQIEPRLGEAEAIVVLGGGLNSDGTLGTSSLYRVISGIRLYRRHLAPVMVFSGPGSDRGVTEAEVAAQLAHELGIPPERILTDSRGKTTREEARWISDLLKQRGIRRNLLVSESEHLRRATRLFEAAGVETLPAPADSFPSSAESPEGRLLLLRRLAQGLVARLYYRLAGNL